MDDTHHELDDESLDVLDAFRSRLNKPVRDLLSARFEVDLLASENEVVESAQQCANIVFATISFVGKGDLEQAAKMSGAFPPALADIRTKMARDVRHDL